MFEGENYDERSVYVAQLRSAYKQLNAAAPTAAPTAPKTAPTAPSANLDAIEATIDALVITLYVHKADINAALASVGHRIGALEEARRHKLNLNTAVRVRSRGSRSRRSQGRRCCRRSQ